MTHYNRFSVLRNRIWLTQRVIVVFLRKRNRVINTVYFESYLLFVAKLYVQYIFHSKEFLKYILPNDLALFTQKVEHVVFKPKVKG